MQQLNYTPGEDRLKVHFGTLKDTGELPAPCIIGLLFQLALHQKFVMKYYFFPKAFLWLPSFLVSNAFFQRHSGVTLILSFKCYLVQ